MRRLITVTIALLLAVVLAQAPIARAELPSPPPGPLGPGTTNTYRIFLPVSTKLPPVPQPGFGYGVQVNPARSVAENAGHIRTLGFGWMKIQVPWKDFEPTQGHYTWGILDTVLPEYSSRGVRVLLSVAKAPAWARSATTNLSFDGPPADPQTYAAFLSALAQRYKGQIGAIEVWNEQNLAYAWGGEPLDATRYVDLLCRAHAALKAVDANIIVISGAPTPTGLNDGNMAVDDQVYVQRMYAAGAGQCFDALGAHAPGYNNPPDVTFGYTDPAEPAYKSHRAFFFRATLEGYRSTMVAHGAAGKRIWVTEMGWASEPQPVPGYDYARNNTLDEQATFEVRAFEMAKAWGWVAGMIIWNLDYGVSHPNSELAYFSLLRPGPLPVYHALAAMSK